MRETLARDVLAETLPSGEGQVPAMALGTCSLR